MWIAFTVGAAIAIGLMVVIAELLPRQPKLSAVIDRIGNVDAVTNVEGRDLQTRLGVWGERNLRDRTFFKVPTADLLVLERSTTTYFSQKLVLALVGLIIPSFVAAALWTIGLPPIFPGIVALLGIPLAVVMLLVGDIMVRDQAAERRLEYSSAVATYTELVSAERRRNATAATALSDAALVGRSRVFTRIREVLRHAELAGIQPWDALGNLAQEIGVPELRELADIMRLGGESGASVAETLRKRASGLRLQLLNDEHLKANQVSERLTYPQSLLGIVFLAMLATPPLMRLLAS